MPGAKAKSMGLMPDGKDFVFTPVGISIFHKTSDVASSTHHESEISWLPPPMYRKYCNWNHTHSKTNQSQRLPTPADIGDLFSSKAIHKCFMEQTKGKSAPEKQVIAVKLLRSFLLSFQGVYRSAFIGIGVAELQQLIIPVTKSMNLFRTYFAALLPGSAGIFARIYEAYDNFMDQVKFSQAFDIIDNELMPLARQSIPPLTGQNSTSDAEQDISSGKIPQQVESKQSKNKMEVTQAQAAMMFGVSEKTIRNWENDHSKARPEYIGRNNRSKLEAQAKLYKAEKANRSQAREWSRYDARDYNRQDGPESDDPAEIAEWNEEQNRKRAGKEPEK